VRNNNSSRFGKLVDVRFDASARLSGTSIRTYLLEKSRISSPNMDERNYHFFFQVLEAETEHLPETSACLCCLVLCRRHLLFLTCR
jgi:myosin heavy subunit